MRDDDVMPLYNLQAEADALSEAWRSRIPDRVGATNLKVLRMDECSVNEEVHEYVWGIISQWWTSGIESKGWKISITSGELYVAEAGIPHTVESGSFVILVIIDLKEEKIV